MTNSKESSSQNVAFPNTLWSVVVQAGDRAIPGAEDALATLCQMYWYPIYAYIRRRNYSRHQAEDLTQEFFSLILAKQVFARADQTKGRFRTYLLTCCQNFLANQGEQARAVKRGGNIAILSLDLSLAGERYQKEPAIGNTPEKIFERRWVLALLDQVLNHLQEEYRVNGQEKFFQRLQPMLIGPAGDNPYHSIAKELGMTEAALRKAVQRLRNRYREILRGQIGATVVDAREIDDEIRQLFAILAE